jgi:ribosomal protein S21
MAIIVKRNKNESKDELIGKFRRLFLEENITDEVKKKVAYSKPSELRYEKKKIAIWRKKCRKRAKKQRGRLR